MANDFEKINFMKEAISLSRFNHPNLIKLHGLVIGKDLVPKFIVVEYMNGGDLLAYLRLIKSKMVRSYYSTFVN